MNRKTILTTRFIILFFAFLFTQKTNAQFAINYTEEIPKIKSGTTYVTMKDTSAVQSKEYIDVIKRYWTISKVKFINYADISKYIAPENSFFTISGYETTTTFSTLMENGGTKDGVDFSNTHIYLELWTCDSKYFTKKKSKGFSNYDKNQVARIELFTDFATLNQPENIYKTDFDGDNHIRNWGKGIFKNYIQQLMTLLNKAQEQTLYDGTSDPVQLKKLRKDTLFIPDYIFIKFNKFTGDETQRHEQKDILGDYEYHYKVLTTEELNNKIMTAQKPFFYLIYIKSSTDKFINVINSSTGDVIYGNYTPVSYNISSSDLKKLSAAIKKE